MNPRAVFDCVVFLQGAIRKANPAGACLQLVENGEVTLYLSPQVLAEVTEVLSRPNLQQKWGHLTPKWVENFVQAIQARAIILPTVPPIFSYPRDPDDEPYINLALAAGAPYLVSRDNDLLDLMQDGHFRQQFPELIILDPVAFLRAVSPKAPPNPPSI